MVANVETKRRDGEANGRKAARRPGWRVDRGAAALGLAGPTNFTKAWTPAVRKVALLMQLDPESTLADLAAFHCPSWELDEARRRLEAVG